MSEIPGILNTLNIEGNEVMGVLDRADDSLGRMKVVLLGMMANQLDVPSVRAYWGFLDKAQQELSKAREQVKNGLDMGENIMRKLQS